MDTNKYKKYLAYRESSDDYSIDSPGWGKYQFYPSTLNYLRDKYNLVDWISKENFLSDHSLQELYEDNLIQDSLSFIDSQGFDSFYGKEITGQGTGKKALLNIYGMLAVIHLGGRGGLSDLLLHNKDHSDHSNPATGGTYLSDYAVDFSNYLNDTPAVFAGFDSKFILYAIAAVIIGVVYYETR